jgi:hypothetical protein
MTCSTCMHFKSGPNPACGAPLPFNLAGFMERRVYATDGDGCLVYADVNLLGWLEEVFSVLEHRGKMSHDDAPDGDSYVTFEASEINALVDDLESAIAKARGE